MQAQKNMNEKLETFWRWFSIGSQSCPGYRRILNRWLIFHFSVGVLLAVAVPLPLNAAANSVLLPLSGLLIGLTFAWAGNAQAHMASLEFATFAKYREGGFVEFIFTYQLAMLLILVTIVAWGLAGLKILSFLKSFFEPSLALSSCELFIKVFYFSLSSLSLRECWHVVLGANMILQVCNRIREEEKNKASRAGNEEHTKKV